MQPHKQLHKAADYFEPLLQVRIRKALLAVRKQISINALALMMAHSRQAKDVIPRKLIEKELQPLKRIIADAFRKGGKVGAELVPKP